jgi:hypothetical protein
MADRKQEYQQACAWYQAATRAAYAAGTWNAPARRAELDQANAHRKATFAAWQAERAVAQARAAVEAATTEPAAIAAEEQAIQRAQAWDAGDTDAL